MAALALLWQGRVAVPMRRDVAEAIWPLAPTMLGFTVASAGARAWTTEERVSPRSGVARRLAFVASVGLLATTTCAALAPLHPFPVLARNTAFLVGLGLVGAMALPASARWMPPVMVPIVMWLLGGRARGLDPAGWAILLHDANSDVALIGSAVALIAGAGLYVGLSQPLADRCR